ncbi:bifunctional diaminohydroxyphosphoribosylaminopyrimidine deaminase/5-amino-6-(5-phosphoribosylamino)uracil reductase RibD [Aquincola sp. S2]|uniref:Riboflavin biosynthesis protein RibD n=2 Tax=Pseudaquabacterium terrae TaxID=2732868 RepID=A0ABX2E9F3_9BURK|nr:bifunctional diaminohydroxyphosphoribosylaminopyrimidine deaminase/5-amino-6-(5-phosphoribosylamino)uracil reductase RibD [Aquabacterium terrae]
MRRALQLAAEAIGLSDPNPRVGCVLVGDGWVAEGHTQAAGQAHAEVMALRMARERGHALAGATAYVTLEPCAHHGRTPPCCDALIEAGLRRVVVASGDPHPQVAGEGLRRLRAAGIEVQVGLLGDDSRELNIGFLSRIERGRPFVRLKVAGSIDGRSALDNGESRWITGPEARADGHQWRKRAGAVLSGIGTVLADDPRLDVRDVPTVRQPLRVIADARLQTPPDARLLDPPGEVLIVAASAEGPAAQALRARGADVRAFANAQGRIDLPALILALGDRGINELHVEAGPRLNAALLEADLVDELLIYQAPLLIGPGRALAALPALAQLADARRFHFIEALCVGADLRLRARPVPRSETVR